jgi:hypothetical protein
MPEKLLMTEWSANPAIHVTLRVQIALIALMLSVICVAPAFAAFINIPASEFGGNELMGDFSKEGTLEFDTRFTSLNPITLRIEIGDTDGAAIAFSGFHLNDAGISWNRLRIGLSGGPRFAEVNQVIPDSGGLAAVTFTDILTTIMFFPPEPLGITLGRPGATIALKEDWFIDLNGLGSGESFNMSLAPSVVAAPASLLLFIAGLAGWLVGRRARLI